MSPIASALARASDEIAALTADLGRRVEVGALRITDRGGELSLGPSGALVSPNGACRLFRAADGWMALNLAREEDRALVPAWLACADEGEPWELVAAHAPERTCGELRARAILLGLPACRVGEVVSGAGEPVPLVRTRRWAAAGGPPKTPKVADLSALWAGPLCGAILAAMGAEVTKVESPRRPDPTRRSTPGFHSRLNGGKAELTLDLAAPEGRARLRDLVLASDVVITSARPRGLASTGLDPDTLLAARPGLVWVAITGYGWEGETLEGGRAHRVAFGDDAAAAGGLLGWTGDGEPRFLGDALADPLTGLAAALGALQGLAGGGGVLVDAAMAPVAARAAAISAVSLAS